MVLLFWVLNRFMNIYFTIKKKSDRQECTSFFLSFSLVVQNEKKKKKNKRYFVVCAVVYLLSHCKIQRKDIIQTLYHLYTDFFASIICTLWCIKCVCVWVLALGLADMYYTRRYIRFTDLLHVLLLRDLLLHMLLCHVRWWYHWIAHQALKTLWKKIAINIIIIL